jgi:hypothetical protein
MFDDLLEVFNEIEDDLKVKNDESWDMGWDTGYEENIWRTNNMKDVWKAE